MNGALIDGRLKWTQIRFSVKYPELARAKNSPALSISNLSHLGHFLKTSSKQVRIVSIFRSPKMKDQSHRVAQSMSKKMNFFPSKLGMTAKSA